MRKVEKHFTVGNYDYRVYLPIGVVTRLEEHFDATIFDVLDKIVSTKRLAPLQKIIAFMCEVQNPDFQLRDLEVIPTTEIVAILKDVMQEVNEQVATLNKEFKS